MAQEVTLNPSAMMVPYPTTAAAISGVLKPAQELELLRDDVRSLIKNIPTVMTRAASTGVTFAAAALAGAVDGGLGENNKLGPGRINVWVAGGAALASIAMDGNPDAEEAAAAIARGFGSAMVYVESRDRSAKVRASLMASKAAAAAATV